MTLRSRCRADHLSERIFGGEGVVAVSAERGGRRPRSPAPCACSTCSAIDRGVHGPRERRHQPGAHGAERAVHGRRGGGDAPVSVRLAGTHGSRKAVGAVPSGPLSAEGFLPLPLDPASAGSSSTSPAGPVARFPAALGSDPGAAHGFPRVARDGAKHHHDAAANGKCCCRQMTTSATMAPARLSCARGRAALNKGGSRAGSTASRTPRWRLQSTKRSTHTHDDPALRRPLRAGGRHTRASSPSGASSALARPRRGVAPPRRGARPHRRARYFLFYWLRWRSELIFPNGCSVWDCYHSPGLAICEEVHTAWYGSGGSPVGYYVLMEDQSRHIRRASLSGWRDSHRLYLRFDASRESVERVADSLSRRFDRLDRHRYTDAAAGK